MKRTKLVPVRCAYCGETRPGYRLWRRKPPKRRGKPGARDGQGNAQAMCALCDRDYQAIYRYKRLPVLELCRYIDRLTERVRLAELVIAHPELGAAAILDLARKPQRAENANKP